MLLSPHFCPDKNLDFVTHKNFGYQSWWFHLVFQQNMPEAEIHIPFKSTVSAWAAIGNCMKSTVSTTRCRNAIIIFFLLVLV